MSTARLTRYQSVPRRAPGRRKAGCYRHPRPSRRMKPCRVSRRSRSTCSQRPPPLPRRPRRRRSTKQARTQRTEKCSDISCHSATVSECFRRLVWLVVRVTACVVSRVGASQAVTLYRTPRQFCTTSRPHLWGGQHTPPRPRPTTLMFVLGPARHHHAHAPNPVDPPATHDASGPHNTTPTAPEKGWAEDGGGIGLPHTHTHTHRSARTP